MGRRAAARRAEGAAAIAFWLAVWQAASVAAGSGVILAGPLDVLAALCRLIPTAAFWGQVGFSCLRIMGGCAAGYAAALALAAASARWDAVRVLLRPALSAVKGTPVACVVVMLLIWFGSRNVSAAAVFLMVLPGIYFPVLEGLDRLDAGSRELFDLMCRGRGAGARRALALVWPGILPYLTAASRTVLGMSWKAGVAAELIGTPTGSIGERIYQAKLLLETSDLFAWTLVVVALSWGFERLALAAIGRTWPAAGRLAAFINGIVVKNPFESARNRGSLFIGRSLSGRETAKIIDSGARDTPNGPRSKERPPVQEAVSADSKGFLTTSRFANASQHRSEAVLTVRDLVAGNGGAPATGPVSFSLNPGETLCLAGPSGAGKTTLLRAIAGSIPAMAGELDVPRGGCSTVFQDTRLVEGLTAAENVALFARGGSAGATKAGARALLAELLPVDALDRPVGELSGGQRRRVEIARALAAPGELILLDEPFTGLDAAARDRAIACIERHRAGRPVTFTAHDGSLARELGAQLVELEPTAPQNDGPRAKSSRP